jgi:CBS-domain-containing membrane protein
MKEYTELIEPPPSYAELVTNDLLGLNPEDRIRRLKDLSREDLKNIMIHMVNDIEDDEVAIQLVAKVLQERRKVKHRESL